MLAGLFLFWWVILFETAVEEMAGFLRLVTVSASGVWQSKHDPGFGVLFSQGQLISKPEAHPYDMGYQAAVSIAGGRSLSDLHKALRLFLPTVRSDYEWGAVDALADEIQRRTSYGAARVAASTWSTSPFLINKAVACARRLSRERRLCVVSHICVDEGDKFLKAIQSRQARHRA